MEELKLKLELNETQQRLLQSQLINLQYVHNSLLAEMEKVEKSKNK